MIYTLSMIWFKGGVSSRTVTLKVCLVLLNAQVLWRFCLKLNHWSNTLRSQWSNWDFVQRPCLLRYVSCTRSLVNFLFSKLCFLTAAVTLSASCVRISARMLAVSKLCTVGRCHVCYTKCSDNLPVTCILSNHVPCLYILTFWSGHIPGLCSVLLCAWTECTCCFSHLVLLPSWVEWQTAIVVIVVIVHCDDLSVDDITVVFIVYLAWLQSALRWLLWNDWICRFLK